MTYNKNESMNCINCHYNDTNSCRRYPPSVSIVMVPRISLVTQKTELQPTDMACFPAVQGEHWCGEWKNREESVSPIGTPAPTGTWVPVFNPENLKKE